MKSSRMFLFMTLFIIVGAVNASPVSAQVVRSEIYAVNSTNYFVDVYQMRYTTNAGLAVRTPTNPIAWFSTLDFIGYLRSNYSDCTRIGMPQSIALVRELFEGSVTSGALVQCSWGLNSRYVLRIGIGAQSQLYALTKIL